MVGNRGGLTPPLPHRPLQRLPSSARCSAATNPNVSRAAKYSPPPCTATYRNTSSLNIPPHAGCTPTACTVTPGCVARNPATASIVSANGSPAHSPYCG